MFYKACISSTVRHALEPYTVVEEGDPTVG